MKNFSLFVLIFPFFSSTESLYRAVAAIAFDKQKIRKDMEEIRTSQREIIANKKTIIGLLKGRRRGVQQEGENFSEEEVPKLPEGAFKRNLPPGPPLANFEELERNIKNSPAFKEKLVIYIFSRTYFCPHDWDWSKVE